MPNSKPLSRGTELVVLTALICTLGLMALANVVMGGVIANQRDTIRLLNETTKPRPCTLPHAANGRASAQ